MCFSRADSLIERTTNPAPLSAYGSPNAVVVCSAHLKFIHPQYGNWQQMPLLPILTLLLFTAHCVSSPVSDAIPVAPTITLPLFNHVSVQEMSSATMKSLTVLSVFVCAGVYQSMSKVNLGCPFRHIHLYKYTAPGPLAGLRFCQVG